MLTSTGRDWLYRIFGLTETTKMTSTFGGFRKKRAGAGKKILIEMTRSGTVFTTLLFLPILNISPVT
jgi:hypothetical protein